VVAEAAKAVDVAMVAVAMVAVVPAKKKMAWVAVEAVAAVINLTT
jgi:hypothetical protein